MSKSALPPQDLRQMRPSLGSYAISGIGGGLVAGVVMGIAEAGWLAVRLGGFSENSVFWWTPVAYGLAVAGLGLIVGIALYTLSLCIRRFASPHTVCGITLGCCLFSSVIVGAWRFQRDVLMSRPLNPPQVLGLVTIFAVAAIVAAMLYLLIARWVKRALPKPFSSAALVPVLVAGMLAGTFTYGKMRPASRGDSLDNPRSQSTGPDIILIAADTLRADVLKAVNQSAAASTPCLDAFAKDSVVFTSAFSNASWTKPSFGTIFSGRYPTSHGAVGKGTYLLEENVTFPELLQQNGYYTMGFANNGNIFSVFRFNQGFSNYIDLRSSLHFYGQESASRTAIYEILRVIRHKVRAILKSRVDTADFYQPGDAVTAKALRWLDSKERPKSRPFFLFLHYMDPHEPFIDRKKDLDFTAAVLQPPLPGGQLPPIDADKYRQPMFDAYISNVECTDKHIGALLEGLKNRGLYENALIVFTSDHGEEFYEHNGWWHGQSLYDEVLHVPLFLKLPGNAKAGTRNDYLARHIDLAPTILDFAGLQPHKDMVGKPLLDLDGSPNNADISYVFAENNLKNMVLQGVRTRDEKIIHANEGNWRNFKPREFYGLVEDPLEKNDLASSGQVRVQQLEAFLEDVVDALRENRDLPLSSQ